MHDLNRLSAEGFYRALASRDGARIAAYLSDDVDWMSMGPVEMLSFCGPRGGKAAVWIPAPLGGLALALRLVPRSAWRRISR